MLAIFAIFAKYANFNHGSIGIRMRGGDAGFPRSSSRPYSAVPSPATVSPCAR